MTVDASTEDDSATTGARIKRYRSELGLTLSQLAETAGVSKSYLSNLENRTEDKRPSANVLFKVAKALGVTMADLLGQEVNIADAVTIDPSLEDFATVAHLSKADVRMLASIKFRGDPPKSVDRWRYIYQALRTSRELDPGD